MRTMTRVILILISSMIFGCEDAYDKEKRYEDELNEIANQKIPVNLKNKIFDLSDDSSIVNEIPYGHRNLSKSNVTAVMWTSDINAEDLVAFDHQFNKELISHNYPVTYKLDSVDYYFVTNIDMEQVGEYIDKEGNRVSDAYIMHQYLFLYDTQTDDFFLISRHKSGDPKEIVQHRIDGLYELGVTDDLDAEDYIELLISKNFYPRQPDSLINKRFYSEEYVEFLEENNYVKS